MAWEVRMLFQLSLTISVDVLVFQHPSIFSNLLDVARPTENSTKTKLITINIYFVNSCLQNGYNIMMVR